MRALVIVGLCVLALPALAAPGTLRKLATASKAPIAAQRVVSTHAPFEMKSCKVCHGKAQPRSAASVRKPLTRLCYSCHGELKSQTGKGKFHHGAVKGGCISCHNPHNSAFKSLLVQSQSKLCGSCHAPATRRR